MAPGETKTFPASIRNNGTWAVTLPTATSDFTARDGTGVPLFVRKSELVYPDQQLSTWISLWATSVTLNPGQEVTIPFTISVPSNATPGGHYGAVFFKNPGSESSAGGTVGINVDYGILVLLTVSWETDTEAEIGDPSINFWGTIKNSSNILNIPNISQTPTPDAWYIGKDDEGNDMYQIPDVCKLWDFSPSRFDGVCMSFDIFASKEDSYEPLLFENDFEVSFEIPVKNIGTTPLKPTGKITLTDEKGDIIQAIGKETISNEQGASIGDKIVDYLPINDEWGNVLPQTNRIFESIWKGFPYKTFDEKWNPTINYWTPSEYYTNKNKENAGFLMPWERVSEVRQNKKIFADIELSYKDENGEDIEFKSAKEFNVQYIEQKVTINPYIILWLLLMSTAWAMVWFALRWWILVVRKRRCWKCKEIIKAHWETCPYCKTLQDKNEQKRFEKQQKTGEKNIQKSQEIPKQKNIPAVKETPKKPGRPKKEISAAKRENEGFKKKAGRPRKESK